MAHSPEGKMRGNRSEKERHVVSKLHCLPILTREGVREPSSLPRKLSQDPTACLEWGPVKKTAASLY